MKGKGKKKDAMMMIYRLNWCVIIIIIIGKWCQEKKWKNQKLESKKELKNLVWNDERK